MIARKVEALIVKMARENSGWGYDRIVGALANLGHRVPDQTFANVLRRYGISPAPQWSQKTTWKESISDDSGRLFHRRSPDLAGLGHPQRDR